MEVAMAMTPEPVVMETAVENEADAGKEGGSPPPSNGNTKVGSCSVEDSHNNPENNDCNKGEHDDKSSSSDRKRSETSSESGGRRRRDRSRSHSRRRSRGHRSRRRIRSRRSRSGERSSSRRRRKERRRRRQMSSSSRSTKSRSRSPDPRRRNRRSGSRRRSDGKSEHQQGGHRSDCKTHQPDSYKFQEPNNTVMVRGLADHLTENDIRQDVLKCGFMAKDIRLIRNLETGASRGFAFAEFNTVAEAVRWMDMKKGLLILQDKYVANLIYSKPKNPRSEPTPPKLAMDWLCEKCLAHNFKWRMSCYKCNARRPEGQDTDPLDEMSVHPSTTIILSNLDTLTTEEGVLEAFQSRPSIALFPIKSVKISREPCSSLSRGACYVEANNVSDASRLLKLLRNEPMEIDGRIAVVAFAKCADQATTMMRNTSNTAAAALAAAQWTNSGTAMSAAASGLPCFVVKTKAAVESMAQYSASLYAKTPEEYTSYLNYYRQYYRQELEKGASAVGSSRNCDHLLGQQQQHSTIVDSNKAVVVASGSEDKMRVDRHDKVKVGKKIVKEMERWAKNLNQKKEVITPVPGEKSVLPEQSPLSSSSSRSSSFPTKRSLVDEEFVYYAAENTASCKPSTIMDRVPEYEGASDDDKIKLTADNNESSFVDESNLACLLCKRRFPSKDVLQKHVKMSALHKNKLEEFRHGSGVSASSSSLSYRDRAQERREKFGYERDVSENTLKELYLQAKQDHSTACVEEPTKSGIKSDNIGNRLLQKMGWKEGQGLGRGNQGRVDIIMEERCAGNFGLGFRAPEVLDEKLDPQTKARKRTLARYQELE